MTKQAAHHQRPYRSRQPRRPAMRCAIIALLVAAGCNSADVQTQGSRQTEASYSVRSLTASLPEWVTPQAVAAAAEQTFRDRGYTVSSAVATTDSVRVVAREPNTGPLKKHIVQATWNRAGSSVSVTTTPLGDQVRSRAILDGVLSRLGL
ncbi:MAG: hypothetical protein KIT19_13740 [Phycisphaeraceae bacterium]|nr:hypothetical protein [Phycisphaeraceae bacterium]